MNVSDQGLDEPKRRRYQTIPRTLVFLTSHHPQTGAREILLLKGAPDKRLWANLYNGLGGHVETDEDILNAAQREVREETGLTVPQLTLRGIINISTGRDEYGPLPGVLIFVLLGNTQSRRVRSTAEGSPEWIPIDELANYPLVDDLYQVIPRVLSSAPLFYAHYTPTQDGIMQYHFHAPAT